MSKSIPKKVNDVLQEFVEGANNIFGNRLKKIILYGSYARGDYNKHSDIDIMILTDLSNGEMGEYQDKIWDYAYDIEYENDFNISLSVLVKNIDKYDARVNVIPFYTNVENEGVILNG